MNSVKVLTKRAIGEVEKEDVERTIDFLNSLLTNEYALFTKNLNYHWNVTGPRFHSLHKFLEGQYQELLPVMDDVAERVRILGAAPISTLGEMKKTMEISEVDGKNLSSNEMIQDLFSSNILIQESIKEFVKNNNECKCDLGTEDFLVGLLQKHEMTSWMLKSHLD